MIKSLKHDNGVLYVFLGLFSHVKAWTVPARAHDVLETWRHHPVSLNCLDSSYLMKRSLAPLTLRP